MSGVRATLALVSTIAVLAALLVATGQRRLTPVDPRLSAEAVWQHSQAATADLTSYSAKETDVFEYANGSRAVTVSNLAIDLRTGSGWVLSNNAHVGPPPPKAGLPPDLPTEVVAQQDALITRINDALGIVEGEPVESMELSTTTAAPTRPPSARTAAPGAN